MLRTSCILLALIVGCATTPERVPETTTPEGVANGTLSVHIEPAAPETTLRIGDAAFAVPQDGKLELTQPAGTYIVSAAAPGYRVTRAAIIVEAGAHAEASLTLEPDPTASAQGSAYGEAEGKDPVHERVAKGAANDAGKRTQSRVVRVYRNWIDRALDLVLGRL